MKIYCLLIDAMPLVDEIKDFAKQKGFTVSRQIASCFTTTTVYGMLTGQLGSDLLPHGIGYHSMGRKDINKFKWFHDKTINLIDICKEKEYEFDFCGNRLPWAARDFLCLSALSDKFTHPVKTTVSNHRQLYYSFDEYEAAFKDTSRFSHVNMITTNPNGTMNKFTYQEYANPILREKFYQREQDVIRKEQEKKQNTFCFWQNCEWSDHTWGSKSTSRKQAIDNVIRWLNFWDTDEEDAYFWIFSDHGDNADDLMSPKSYLSWVISKDNTKLKPETKAKTFVSHMDFYKTILNKLDYSKDTADSKDVYEELDVDRLYFFEDGRMHSNLTESNAASVVKILYDKDKHPESLIQFCYHSCLGGRKVPSTYAFQYDLKRGQLLKNVDEMGKSQLGLLKEKLFERVSWIKEE